MTDALACDAIHTPIKRVPRVDWSAVDVLLGCANQAGEDKRNVARMATRLAGLPDAVPGATIDCLCGRGPTRSAAERRRSEAAMPDS